MAQKPTQKSGTRTSDFELDAPQRVARELQRRIIIGELRPGEQIRQSEWADRLGVSGVPVREALKVLETQDFLVHDPRRGYFVTSLTPQQVDQLYEMRMLIEARLMRSLRWPSSDEYDSIEKLWTRWLEELRVGDLEVANENYGQALSSIWELSSLDLFIREARRFWYRTNPYRMVTFAAARAADPTMKSLRSDATALLGGLREHNRPAILHATTSRLKRARQNWLRIFAPTNGAARTARPIV